MHNKEKVDEIVEDVFGRYPTEELLVELDRIGVPTGRIRSIREVYDWEQTRSQALLIDVNLSTLGSPLRFFDPDGTEVTRTHHLPPVLGADNDTVAGWLLQGAFR